VAWTATADKRDSTSLLAVTSGFMHRVPWSMIADAQLYSRAFFADNLRDYGGNCHGAMEEAG
jgi:hypothetical protein